MKHTLYRGQRDTRICLYLVSFTTLYYIPMSYPMSLPLFPLSLFHPIRFRHRCLLCPFQVKSRLLPPPHPHPRPRCPLCLLTQVRKRLLSYELRERVLHSPNVLFYCLKYRLLPCCCNRGVFPFPVCMPPRDPPCQLLRHMVLEPPPPGPVPCGG